MDFSDPELLKTLLGIGGIEGQDDQLAQQLEMIGALRQQQPHSTGWGGALGAIAQGINGANQGYLNKKRMDLLDERKKALNDLVTNQKNKQQGGIGNDIWNGTGNMTENYG